jgi:hypothetical protein
MRRWNCPDMGVTRRGGKPALVRQDSPECGRGQAAGRGRAARTGRRDRVAQFAAARGRRAGREGRPCRLLDLHLHQLAAHATVCPRLGRQVYPARVGGHRRAHARVRVRARRRQRPPGGAGHAGQLSSRDRQRLRGMGRVRQPLLARPLLCRCAGTYPPPSVRRGRVRAVGDDHPATPVRGGIRWHRSRAGLGRGSRGRGSRRLGRSPVTGELRGLRAHREFRVSRRPGAGHSSRL